MTTGTKFQNLRWGAVLLLCAAAAAARIWWPGAASRAETWFLGPEGNQVTAAFAALEGAMGDGVGAAVEAFYTEFSDNGHV